MIEAICNKGCDIWHRLQYPRGRRLGAAWEDLAGSIDIDAQSVLSCLVQISALTWSLDLKADSRHRNPSTCHTSFARWKLY